VSNANPWRAITARRKGATILALLAGSIVWGILSDFRDHRKPVTGFPGLQETAAIAEKQAARSRLPTKWMIEVVCVPHSRSEQLGVGKVHPLRRYAEYA
jgi:hypothetical protein